MPLSQISTFLLLKWLHFEIMFNMSAGAKNWPFFILIGKLVLHAASIRSVCLLRKAGICIMSKTSDACCASSEVCISEIMGTL